MKTKLLLLAAICCSAFSVRGQAADEVYRIYNGNLERLNGTNGIQFTSTVTTLLGSPVITTANDVWDTWGNEDMPTEALNCTSEFINGVRISTRGCGRLVSTYDYWGQKEFLCNIAYVNELCWARYTASGKSILLYPASN
ncbi:MAG: hypothetical protein ACK5XN_36725 [Bacteroidota bacterium]